MKVIAGYNIKGGVGKTAAIVNLAHLAAGSGHRTLVWDLDPQGAATFYFRVKPKPAGGIKRLVEGRRDLHALVKETDYENLDLLRARFSFRNLDLALADSTKPLKRFATLIRPLAASYDLLLFDCAPGITLTAESVFGASHALLVPTIPTTLSLRTLEQLSCHLAARPEPPAILAFFSMVDVRKSLHRRICETGLASHDFLRSAIPYASVVEQMGLRRAPVTAYAPRQPPRACVCGPVVRGQPKDVPGGDRMSTYETDLDAARIISLVGEAFRVRRESSRPVRVTYLDTFDWRLFQAGARLSIWHVRSDVHARLETAAAAHQCELPADFVADFAWNLPSGHLRQALAAMTEVRRLLELAELDMVEHRLSILNGDDKTVARVRIDEISSRRPDVRNEPRSDATPTVLCTVSALIGYSASRKVARCLETNPEFEPVERGLFEIALDNAGQIPGSYATKLQLVLSPDTLAPDAVKTVGIALLETMVANEGGVREKVDSEFLHDFRIAVRRTRSLLAQVKGAFPPTRLTGFRAEFGWLGDITGGPRDLDVHRLKMADHKRELPSSIGGHLDPRR